MSIKISFKKSISAKTSSNLVLFVDEKFNIKPIKKYISSSEFFYISDLLKIRDLKKKLLVFELSSKKKLVLISIKKNIKNCDIENLGAEFYGIICNKNKSEYFINSESLLHNHRNFIGHFLHGLKLKSYDFKKYKTKKEKNFINIIVIGRKNNITPRDRIKFVALEEGTFYARDLVSEPGNVLHPDEYAKRIKVLKKYGLKINIYNQKNLKKLGMNALLGVGQGSIRGSYLVTMEWRGVKNNSKPLAFMAFGVVFHS